MLAAVILSGGASSRMGSPKALLPYQGRPFLEHLLEVTLRPEIGVRRVVLGAHAEPIAKVVDLKADEIVINHEWERGQLSSIQAALRSLPPGTDGILLCLIDHPLIRDRKSTRLNSSHGYISYAVFCLKKKKKHIQHPLQTHRPMKQT